MGVSLSTCNPSEGTWGLLRFGVQPTPKNFLDLDPSRVPGAPPMSECSQRREFGWRVGTTPACSRRRPISSPFPFPKKSQKLNLENNTAVVEHQARCHEQLDPKFPFHPTRPPERYDPLDQYYPVFGRQPRIGLAVAGGVF